MDGATPLLAAFFVGLLGSVHCLGMCGGIVAVLNFATAPQEPAQRRSRLLAYNLGRIASYAVAGAITGAIGQQVGRVGAHPFPLGTLFSGLFMLALGAALAGWWSGLTVLEQWGAVGWRRIEPLGRRLLPVRSTAAALGLGAVWGWLPCGLVYSALVLAAAQATPGAGALTMAAFGLGTLPMLLAMGGATTRLGVWTRHRTTRRLAGGLIILLGVFALYQTGVQLQAAGAGSGAH